MKVLLVNGSPHSEGSTYVALHEIEKTLTDNDVKAKIYQIGNADIKGCVACGRCIRNGYCVFDDDVVNSFVDKAKSNDGFVFGGPVYYGSINPTLSNFMTRVFYSPLMGGENYFRLKPAAAVASARRTGTMTSIDTVNRFFASAEMPIISSSYWNEIHGRGKDEALKDEEALQTMRNLARNMAWFLKIKELSLKEGIPLPCNEYGARTNFI